MRDEPMAQQKWTRLSVTMMALVAVSPSGCEGTIDGPPGPCDSAAQVLAHLRIDRVQHLSPVLVGTELVVRGEGFANEAGCTDAEVALIGSTGGQPREVRLEPTVSSLNDLTVTVSPDAASRLGRSGTWSGTLEVRFALLGGGQTQRASIPLSFALAESLVPEVSALGQGEVYLNDRVAIEGDGFLAAGEGVTEVELSGTCVVETTGAIRRVTGLPLQATLVEGRERAEATFEWSPYLCGVAPGEFSGTLTPRNLLASGEVVEGVPRYFEMVQRETLLLELSPEEVSLGQLVDVVGRGFIGGEAGTTTIRLDGEVYDDLGIPYPLQVEVVGYYDDGSLIRYPLSTQVLELERESILISADLGIRRGTFVGSATPVLTMEDTRHEGIGSEVRLTVGPLRQIVWVRFIDGFAESVELFGLGAVEGEVRARVLERMQEVYCPPDDSAACVNVVFRAERPDDFDDSAYTIVDIGGADPNNLGLLGYDANPQKDVDNLRLHDHVGGENASGALDGLAYGGIFIESLIFWSEHPPFDERPPAAPPPEPRFDDIFDPIRYNEVVAGEWPDGASAARLAQIDLAIHVLASQIADIAAHELGHSLGMAMPDGARSQFHNIPPGEGCIMDSGRDRPFEERSRLDGHEGSRFCMDNLQYLRSILPVD